MPDPRVDPLFNAEQALIIHRALRHAHVLVVDACVSDGNHVPESVMPVLDAIADAMREVSSRRA